MSLPRIDDVPGEPHLSFEQRMREEWRRQPQSLWQRPHRQRLTELDANAEQAAALDAARGIKTALPMNPEKAITSLQLAHRHALDALAAHHERKRKAGRWFLLAGIVIGAAGGLAAGWAIWAPKARAVAAVLAMLGLGACGGTIGPDEPCKTETCEPPPAVCTASSTNCPKGE